MGMANSNHPNCQTILWHAFKLLLMYFNFDLSNSNQLSKDRRSIPIIFTMSIHKSLFMLNASLWTGRPMTSSQNVLYDIILIFLKYWLIGPLAHDPKAFLVLSCVMSKSHVKIKHLLWTVEKSFQPQRSSARQTPWHRFREQIPVHFLLMIPAPKLRISLLPPQSQCTQNPKSRAACQIF